MRLVQLFENSLQAGIKDAIGVMLARSKSTGQPYSLDLKSLAHMIGWPGDLSRSDIEATLNNDPALSASVQNFDDLKIEVNASTDIVGDEGMEEPLPDMGMPPEQDMGMDMGAPAGDMGMDTSMGAPDEVEAVGDEEKEQVKKIDAVKKAAERAAKRRGL